MYVFGVAVAQEVKRVIDLLECWLFNSWLLQVEC